MDEFGKNYIAEKPLKVASWAELRECPTTGSKSLHTTVEFMPGQVISKFGVKKSLEQPNYLSLQIGERQHIMLHPEFLHYLNHSCAPNVFFAVSDRVLRAMTKIEIGEELTFFYPSTEWSMDRGFDCICQSKDCLGTIRGAAYLPLDILTKYKLAQHIQQRLAKRH
ncbi:MULTISPECIES: SET domain-containing protein-lysine N-methyltransferase [Moorena]|uniref:SET domain protein n=1 Tax=Moorena producens 3L TaxID=489825 RepID=F4XXS7_9CYAN|nr:MULTISPECIES: SET domain-containing protein-lysine N-methyltransferase [Moorena]NES81642.1 SET domain-containing protein [Moorena sp. SIO2B7]EGJ30580.1 SET domain protein [Moorena producens 3L]NEP32614.1 SET domain-containing protein [Moorena sp. SIO3B2]NEP68277.1 SET domain-containing protein [Moorena sp. SIO3A5]NEQ06804.1 SET domain-containing protein [Moorena sp. SIO4E2]